jgi:hypothetical protein
MIASKNEASLCTFSVAGNTIDRDGAISFACLFLSALRKPARDCSKSADFLQVYSMIHSAHL